MGIDDDDDDVVSEDGFMPACPRKRLRISSFIEEYTQVDRFFFIQHGKSDV